MVFGGTITPRHRGNGWAVAGIDLDVLPGETFGFLGPNGAGKSTIIGMLCTLVTPTSGTAQVAGLDVRHQRDSVRRNIGLVFQDTTLDGYLSAEANLRVHAELYGVPRGGLPARMEQMLTMVGLWERRHEAPTRDRPGVVAQPGGAVSRRAHGGTGPSDSCLDLAIHQRVASPGGHHHLYDYPLHGRG